MKNAQERNSWHRWYTQRMKNTDIDRVKTNQWQKTAGLKTETEG